MRNATGALLVAALLTGCAHPMTIKPDVTALAAPADSTRIAKNIGLYISPENRNKTVTTPGGGGDKVTYRPYADLETGLYKVLGNVFQNVEVLSSMSDVDFLAKHSLVLIAVPEISTTSSSKGLLTWMATDLSVQLTCRITDVAGRTVATVSSTGTGHADYSELKSNFSLAGEKASQDVLTKIQLALLGAPELRR
jgi:hypothetical protein